MLIYIGRQLSFLVVDPEKIQKAFGDVLEVDFGKGIGTDDDILIRETIQEYLLKW